MQMNEMTENQLSSIILDFENNESTFHFRLAGSLV